MRRWIPHGTFYQLCLLAVLGLLIAACSNDGTGPTATDGSPGSTTTNEGSTNGGTGTTNGQGSGTSTSDGSGTTTSGGTGTTSGDGNGTGTTDGSSGTTEPGTVTTTSPTGTTTTSTTGTSTTVTAAPSGGGLIGYLGCSMTTDAAFGYQAVGGTALWPAGEGDYSGGALDLWGTRVGASQMWTKFQAKLDANPGTTVLWWELCTTEASRSEDFELGLSVLSEIEARLGGGATIYVSAQPDYDGHVCPTSGPNGPAEMQVLAAQLVGTGRVLAGPFQGPLNEAQTRDLCHASESGRLILGNQVLAFFGG